MALIINPAQVHGAWRLGWTLDVHTTSSEFLGYDQNGNARFDTKRSPLGELLYQLKYRGQSTDADVAAVMAEFMETKPNTLARTDLVVPMPSSTVRPVQPVVTIAQHLAKKLRKPVANDAIRKIRDTPELKNIDDAEERRDLLEGAYEADRAMVEAKGILLVDDLYRSGATANAVTLALLAAGASRVYLLVATRTRSNV